MHSRGAWSAGLRNGLWVPSSLPLGVLRGLPAEHLEVFLVSQEPRGWFCLFPHKRFPCHVTRRGVIPRRNQENLDGDWWDITKAAKLMGLWERGAAHTALQVIPAKPDFPSVSAYF